MDPVDQLLSRSRRLHPHAADRFIAKMDAKTRADRDQPVRMRDAALLGEPHSPPPRSGVPLQRAGTLKPPPAVAIEPIYLGPRQDAAGAPAFAWDIAAQPNPFLWVAGSSGSGKTELLRVLGYELGRQGLPLLAMDVHGDLRIPELPRLRLGRELGINPLGAALRPGDTLLERRQLVEGLLRQAVHDIGHLQQAYLRQALERAYAARAPSAPTLRDLRDALLERNGTGVDRGSLAGLVAALDQLFEDPVFSAPRLLSADDLLQRGAVLDLSPLSRPAQIVVIGSVLAGVFQRLYAAGPMPSQGSLRVFVLLDEAAMLSDSALLEQLAREARKFGLGMAVAAQELRDIGRALLANAASAAVFHLESRPEAVLASRVFRGTPPERFLALQPPGECLFRDAGGVAHLRVAPLAERAEK